MTLFVSFVGLDALFGRDEARIFSKIGPKSALDKKETIRTFVKEYGWDKNHAGRIWDYG